MLTIPIEDAVYGYSQFLMIIYFFKMFQGKGVQDTLTCKAPSSSEGVYYFVKESRSIGFHCIHHFKECKVVNTIEIS
jgi:hypothetical protein